jgi:hypothetical protein
MEIPEIQYQPGQVSSNVAPVEQVDITAGLRANQQRTANEMQANLAQLQRNGATQVQNVRDQAFPVEQLTQLSQTAAKLMDEKVETMKSDLEAEMTMLAYQDGFSPTKEFEESEKEFQKTGQEMDQRANNYQRETGDYEGAERVRNLSGWKKYYYEKARAEQAGQGFGAWLNENASRQVPVNGEMVSLKQANPEQRAAVVAYLSSEYMRPYQGYNKSFLGKYLFPGMQKGQASTMAALSAERQKLIKANQLDEAGVLFRSNVTAEGAQQFRNTLLAQGFSNAQVRAKMMENASTVAQVEAIGAIDFGGNGKSFAENYPTEYNEALNNAVARQDDGVTRELTVRKQADQKAKLEYMKAEEQDLKDGSFDADPAMLAEKAAEARMNGYPETAKYIESRIAETAGAKTSAAIRKGYELQMMSGIIPSKEEILMNPALTTDDKQALIGKAQENAGQAEPAGARAKSNKKEIEAELEARAGWTKDKAANASIEGMKFKAWQEYTTIYNNAIESGKSPDVAAQEAMADFRSKFGDDIGKGPYAVGIDPNTPGGLGQYTQYDRTAAASTTTSPFSQFTTATKGMTPEQTAEYFNNQPEIFKGEAQMLTNLAAAAEDTGQIGAIPPLYYELQQKSAGKQDILEMVETRLKANKLPPLPKNVTAVVSEVKGAFDEESYKYITYKPNATRTDIGLISSGQEPVYSTSLPTNVASDQEFQAAVSDTAQRLGVSEADLMAVMSFETGGTFNPGIANAAGSGATGLIQFMPSTAAGLGTSTQELAGMSRAQQMQYVEKYLSNKNVKGKGLSDLYMAVLFPAAVGKPDDFVLFGNGATIPGYGAGSRAYSQNRGLDKNGDGSVTKAEASAKVMQHRNPNPWRRPNNMRPELQ